MRKEVRSRGESKEFKDVGDFFPGVSMLVLLVNQKLHLNGQDLRPKLGIGTHPCLPVPTHSCNSSQEVNKYLEECEHS